MTLFSLRTEKLLPERSWGGFGVGQVAQLEAETALVALKGLASLSKELLDECHAEAKCRAPAAGMPHCFKSPLMTQ